MNPREAAYLAILASTKQERFIEETLSQWRQSAAPSQSDYHLAERIACGTVQMMLALDALAKQLATKQKLSLKLKERVLLRLSLYQYFYLDRIPLYAIVDESVKLAHKYCHRRFAEFLNAILRRLSSFKPVLPNGNSVADLSTRYSYPDFFTKKLIDEYGLDVAREILEVGNIPPKIMLRLRDPAIPSHWDLKTTSNYAVLNNPQQLTEIAASPKCYIQNATPASLIDHLAQKVSFTPTSILDLCASPGGKLFAAHDAFATATLFANDVSAEKVQRLKENCQKYQLNPSITCGRGETYVASQPFDLIIVDAPCSNSGVLNKRPEARWRISQEALSELRKIQIQLLEHASSLLSPNGELWYMTCSILCDENEEIVKHLCETKNLRIRDQDKVLPNRDGWDGGFACALCRK